jgi:cobalt-zinc-cadmium efflux system membrane fusion protein
MSGKLGDRVSRGQTLRVESSHSLQTYAVPAPISGTIIEKNANVGDTTGDRAPFAVAVHEAPAGSSSIPATPSACAGQRVSVRSLSGEAKLDAPVEAVLPTADVASQTMMAHVHLPPEASRTFRPGMGVEGSFAVAEAASAARGQDQGHPAVPRFRGGLCQGGQHLRGADAGIGRRTPEWTKCSAASNPAPNM